MNTNTPKNNGKKKDIIELIALIILPVLYLQIYHMTASYVKNGLEDFLFENILIPHGICAVVICLFSIVFLLIAWDFGKKSGIKRLLVIAILLIHFIVNCCFHLYPSYLMYIEVLSSWLILIVLILMEPVVRKVLKETSE